MGRQICKRIKMFFFFAFGAPLWIYDIIMKNAYLQLIPSITLSKVMILSFCVHYTMLFAEFSNT